MTPDNSFLSQDEIDALLNNSPNSNVPGNAPEEQLTSLEQDALGEIGNISMGSAATVLSQLLNQRVSITTPRIKITTQEELFNSFDVPYLVVEINFDDGLKGSNLLVLKIRDAAVIADLMMGNDGQSVPEELSELSSSAVSEAMNQMIGSAATAMATVFNREVKITPPRLTAITLDESYHSPTLNGDTVVMVSFRLVIGELIDSDLMQVLPLRIAKEEAGFLLGGMAEAQPAPSVPEPPRQAAEQPAKPAEAAADQSLPETKTNANLDLILDVPLKVSVVLGKNKKTLAEITNMSLGSVMELDRLANDPVEVLVNDTLIGWGEVVVVNESFGVRITKIISPQERVSNLRG